MKIIGKVTHQGVTVSAVTGYLAHAFFIDNYSSSVFAFSNKYGIYWYN